MYRYAEYEDFVDFGVPEEALGSALSGETSVDQALVERFLDLASGIADTYVKPRYEDRYPLEAPYDPALVDAVIQIARYRLFSRRGYNPEPDGSAPLRDGYEDAVSWLKRVADGHAVLAIAGTAGATIDQPDCVYNESRGYEREFSVIGSDWGE
jgi:phage gp36-like protein